MDQIDIIRQLSSDKGLLLEKQNRVIIVKQGEKFSFGQVRTIGSQTIMIEEQAQCDQTSGIGQLIPQPDQNNTVIVR